MLTHLYFQLSAIECIDSEVISGRGSFGEYLCYPAFMTHHHERPPKAEVESLARLLGQTFIQRRDMYPHQLEDGSYITVHQPLLEQNLTAHLRGDLTLGAYLLRPDATGRFVAIDADDNRTWKAILQAARLLSSNGLPSYLESSRRGGHW